MAREPSRPNRTVRPVPARTQRPRMARADTSRTPSEAGDRDVQTEDSGPDPSKPAEVAIEASGPAGTPVERPTPNGNARDRFRDLAPEHGLLVGMRVGYITAFGGSKVGAIQPIFQAGSTYSEGKQFGVNIGPSVTVVARPGYAVGAINTRSGLMLDSFQVVFMRFKGGRLETKDSYTSDWLGDPRGGGAGTASGDGKLVVGVHGRSNGREVNALGLLVAQ